MLTLITVLAGALAGPPVVVALSALGVPWHIGTLAVALAAILALSRTRTGAAEEVIQLLRRRPAVILLVIALGGATFYGVRLSRFMMDPGRPDLSVLPAREFFCRHSCLTAYTEGARLVRTDANVYDVRQYVDTSQTGRPRERLIGPFRVDFYQFPPPFLIAPRAAVAAGLDFFRIRRLWFGVQAVLLFAAMAMLARWVGGPRGTLALLLIPLLWLAIPTRLGLQLGNFQLTVFALSIFAMVAFDTGQTAAGGLALGFATASRVYPGILGLHLFALQRHAAVAWTAVYGTAITLIAWLLLGSGPFVDFYHYLPRIVSGDASSWINSPLFAPVNQSIYGLVTKLRALGVPATGHNAANFASALYAVLLLPLAVVAGRQLNRLAAIPRIDPGLLRARQAQVWLALLSLASFRSPFVPDAYGYFGTLWLLTLIAAEGHWRAGAWILFAAAGAAFCLVLDGGLVPTPVPGWMVLSALGIQLTALALNFGVILLPRRGLPARAPAKERIQSWAFDVGR